MLRDGLPPLGIVLDEDGIEGDLLGDKDQQVIEEFQGLLRRKATSQSRRCACRFRHSNYGSSNWSLQDKIRLIPHWGNGCHGQVSYAYVRQAQETGQTG